MRCFYRQPHACRGFTKMTRTKAKRLRDGLPAEARAEYSERITRHLLAWPVFERAQSVMAYVSFRSEVDTKNLLPVILSHKKRLYLPRCGKKGRMDAVETPDLFALVPGMLSIMEPCPSLSAANKHEIDLILTPGLAFDWTGARLGWGGGYYDRFLSDYHGMTCGLAFSVQIAQKLSRAGHDIDVQALATELGITKC